MPLPDRNVAELRENATEAAGLLRLLANENRLRLLCVLAGGERTVNDLADTVGLGQSAVSQHLARLRADGLVAFRREGTTLHYRIADADALMVLGTLRDIYCSAGSSLKQAEAVD